VFLKISMYKIFDIWFIFPLIKHTQLVHTDWLDIIIQLERYNEKIENSSWTNIGKNVKCKDNKLNYNPKLKLPALKPCRSLRKKHGSF